MKRFNVLAVLVVLAGTAFGQSKVFVKDGVAINGYDAVAYFTESKPVKGDARITTKWNNATWLFASKANLEKFKKSPEKFAPQFGGFCAYGMSQGHAADTDPNAFTVVNNKLYLNYNPEVKEMWSKDRDNLINKADKNWAELKTK
jgi:hypothetical protein